jgi:ParB-like chromosome segregation protein Spo0J
MAAEDMLQPDYPVVMMPVDLIDVPADRLRGLKPLQAKAIGAAILADRQYDAITVAAAGERFVLVDGLHRLEGLKALDVELIEARIVPDDRAGNLRQEIASAWARADHDAFDRAAQIAALADIARKNDPVQSIALVLKWDEEACDALGVSRRTLFNYLSIHRHFDADQKALLRGLEQANELVPLLRLAALPPADFDRAMAGLADGSFATIAEALAPPDEAAPSPFVKKSNAFLTFLRLKATPRERADLMRQLKDEYLDDGRLRGKSRAKAG